MIDSLFTYMKSDELLPYKVSGVLQEKSGSCTLRVKKYIFYFNRDIEKRMRRCFSADISDYDDFLNTFDRSIDLKVLKAIFQDENNDFHCFVEENGVLTGCGELNNNFEVVPVTGKFVTIPSDVCTSIDDKQEKGNIKVSVGDKVYIPNQKRPFTVKARDDRY